MTFDIGSPRRSWRCVAAVTAGQAQTSLKFCSWISLRALVRSTPPSRTPRASSSAAGGTSHHPSFSSPHGRAVLHLRSPALRQSCSISHITALLLTGGCHLFRHNDRQNLSDHVRVLRNPDRTAKTRSGHCDRRRATATRTQIHVSTRTHWNLIICPLLFCALHTTAESRRAVQNSLTPRTCRRHDLYHIASSPELWQPSCTLHAAIMISNLLL